MAPDPDSMSISQLREYLNGAGVDFADCVEKKDLVRRAKETQARGGGAGPSGRAYDPLGRNKPRGGTSSSSSSRPQARTTTRPQPAAEPAKKTQPDASDRSEEAELVRKVLRTKDYYEILGLSRGASEIEVKKAYRKMALKLHPDKCKIGGGEDAFKLVSSAFDTLSDPDKKAHYDRTGSFNPHAADGAGPGGGMGGMSPEDIFNAFFGGGGGGFPGGGGMGGGFPGGGFGGFPMGGMGPGGPFFFSTGGGFPGGMGGFPGGGFGGMPRQRAQHQQQSGGGGGGGGAGGNRQYQQSRGAGGGGTPFGFNMDSLRSPKAMIWLFVVVVLFVTILGPLLLTLLANAPMFLLLQFVPAQYRKFAMIAMLLYMVVG